VGGGEEEVALRVDLEEPAAEAARLGIEGMQGIDGILVIPARAEIGGRGLQLPAAAEKERPAAGADQAGPVILPAVGVVPSRPAEAVDVRAGIYGP
jgi:hypothetical protein